jgi:hypothetical protein
MIGATVSGHSRGHRLRLEISVHAPCKSARTRLAKAQRMTTFDLEAPRARVAREALGASERFFVKLRRFTPINVTRVVAISGSLAPADLARALAALQVRHPLLRASIEEGARDEFVYDAAPPLQLQVVPRQDDEHFRRLLEQLLNTPLAQSTQRLFAFHYLYDPACSRAELIVVGEHAVCDGVSLNQLCCELLSLAARFAPVELRPRLPTLERMLPAFSVAERLHALGASLVKMGSLALNRARLERRAAARTTAFSYVTLTPEETASLIGRARAEHTTVTGALMASALLTLRELSPDVPELGLSLPINLRSRLPGHALRADDLGNYTSAVYLSHASRAELWPLARAMKYQLDEAASSERLLAAVPLVYRIGRLLIRPGARPLAHAMLSNSGLVGLRGHYGTFRPTAFYSASSAPMLSADLALFCNTCAGRLTINLLFSPELMSRAQAARIGQALRSHLGAQRASLPGLFTAA